MTKNYLFPSQFQKLGYILLIPFGLLFLYFSFTTSESKIELNVPVFAIINNDIGNSTQWFTLIKNDIMDEIDLELNLKLFCDPLYKNNPLKSKG